MYWVSAGIKKYLLKGVKCHLLFNRSYTVLIISSSKGKDTWIYIAA